jgi:glycosyltransferase involved in cell wall biosynthesis
MSAAKFVVASPGHASIYDNEALALHRHGLLKFIAMGTRRGVDGLPMDVTRLLPSFGLWTYATAKTFSRFPAESLRFRAHPYFDNWVRKQLTPGDHVISSYGYANNSFKWARAHGGKTFLDAGNSHPDSFWTLLKEEQRRWKSPYEPVAKHHYERSLAMMENVDYVLSASTFVTNTFLEHGFKRENILHHPRPIDLSAFYPAKEPRPRNRPLTIIGTGTLCLRKGSPYLFEAFRLIKKQVPDARFVLRNVIAEDFKSLLPQYSDIPVTWLEGMPHAKLADHLREADIFILPSLEDGLALTVVEALACGLPVITTPNTGASEMVRPDINGEVVAIRDPQAIAEGVMKWTERILVPGYQPQMRMAVESLTFDHFDKVFMGQLWERGLA